MFWKNLKQSAQNKIAYRVKENIDPNLVNEVVRIFNEHHQELQDAWTNTSRESRAQLMEVFHQSLEREYPRELSEIVSSHIIVKEMENFNTNIKSAYAAGYMFGKGWISPDQLSEYMLNLGDQTANLIRTNLKGAKCRGYGFSSAFTAVGGQGHLVAINGLG